MILRCGLVCGLFFALAAHNAASAEESAARPTDAEIVKMFEGAGCARSRSKPDFKAVETFALEKGAALVAIDCHTYAYNWAVAYFVYRPGSDGIAAEWEPLGFPVMTTDDNGEYVRIAATPTLMGGRYDPKTRRFHGYYKGAGWGGCGERYEYALSTSGRPALLKQWAWNYCGGDADMAEFRKRFESNFDSFLVYPEK